MQKSIYHGPCRRMTTMSIDDDQGPSPPLIPHCVCLGTQWAFHFGCRRGCSLSKSASPPVTPANINSEHSCWELPCAPRAQAPAERTRVPSTRSSQAGGQSEWCRQRPDAVPGQGWKMLFTNGMASGNMGLPARGVLLGTSQIGAQAVLTMAL